MPEAMPVQPTSLLPATDVTTWEPGQRRGGATHPARRAIDAARGSYRNRLQANRHRSFCLQTPWSEPELCQGPGERRRGSFTSCTLYTPQYRVFQAVTDVLGAEEPATQTLSPSRVNQGLKNTPKPATAFSTFGLASSTRLE